MAATIDGIDAALMTALEALKATDPGAPTTAKPFAYVGRYRGEVTRAHGVDTETLGAATACLLAFEGEQPEDRQGVQTLLKGPAARVARSLWRIYVVVQRVDDVDPELKGDGSDLGVFALIDAVVGAVNGLAVAGLHAGERVRWLETKPHLILPGQVSVYVVRLSAMRLEPQTFPARPGVPLARIDGDVNHVPSPEPAAPTSDPSLFPLRADPAP